MLLTPYHADDDDDDNIYEDADQENKECLRLFAPYDTTDLFDSLCDLFGRVSMVVLSSWYHDHLGDNDHSGDVLGMAIMVLKMIYDLDNDDGYKVGLTRSHQISWYHLWWQIIQLPILQPPKHVFSPVALDT